MSSRSSESTAHAQTIVVLLFALIASATARTVHATGNLRLGGPGVVEHDRARAAAQLTLGDTRPFNHTYALSERAGIGSSVGLVSTGSVFSVNVTVGANTGALLVDTGSANTWLGAQKAYVTSASTRSTGQSLSITYGSGVVSGQQLTDTVSIGSLRVTNQQVGSTTPNLFAKFSVNGILGLGPTALTVGKLSPATASSSPTLLDTLVAQDVISAPVFAIYFIPSFASAAGQLSFGGIDPTKNSSAFVSVRRSTKAVVDKYWSCSVSLAAGSTPIATSAPAMTDTGTTLIVVASDYFQACVRC